MHPTLDLNYGPAPRARSGGRPRELRRESRACARLKLRGSPESKNLGIPGQANHVPIATRVADRV